jgi:hypothetical protein
MAQPKTLARIAGLFYLANGVGFIAAKSIQARIFVPGNGSATAGRIRASTTPLRSAIYIDLASGASLTVAALVLSRLLRHVNESAATAMVTFAAIGTGIGSLNLVNQYAALTIATRPDAATAVDRAGPDELVGIFTDLNRAGLVLAEMFWGLWLLPLGFLVSRSGYFPRWLGYLLMAGCFSWMGRQFVEILAPNHARRAVLLTAGAAGEVVMIGWLLIKGADAPQAGGPPAAA